jgi:hypothetical protein
MGGVLGFGCLGVERWQSVIYCLQQLLNTCRKGRIQKRLKACRLYFRVPTTEVQAVFFLEDLYV